MQLKPIHKEAIASALEKAVRYRVLNEPLEAESICQDVLEIGLAPSGEHGGADGGGGLWKLRKLPRVRSGLPQEHQHRLDCEDEPRLSEGEASRGPKNEARRLIHKNA